MKDLAAIEAIFAEISADLDNRLALAQQARESAGIQRLEQKRRINDSAYFILAWGQLEAEISRAAQAAVRRHRSSIRWDERRAWDAHDPDNMRAKFEDRAALVLDRLSAAYKKTIRYYGWRNSIAHGRNLAAGIDVAFIIRDFYQIAGAIST